MSLENKLHAALLVAFVALVFTTFLSSALDDAAAVAKSTTTQIAAATAALPASR